MLKDKLALFKPFGSFVGLTLKAEVQMYKRWGRWQAQQGGQPNTAARRGWVLPGLLSWCLWQMWGSFRGIRKSPHTHTEGYACVPLCTHFRLQMSGRFCKNCSCEPCGGLYLLRLLICRLVTVSKMLPAFAGNLSLTNACDPRKDNWFEMPSN